MFTNYLNGYLCLGRDKPHACPCFAPPATRRSKQRSGLANPEHLCPAHRADPSHCWPLVLQRDILGVLYLPFRPTLEAVGLRHPNHLLSALLNIIAFGLRCQVPSKLWYGFEVAICHRRRPFLVARGPFLRRSLAQLGSVRQGNRLGSGLCPCPPPHLEPGGDPILRLALAPGSE